MALRFHERESGIGKYPNVDPASWAPCVSGFSDPTTAGSSCLTPTANGGVLRRGEATDLMEQVGDVLAAPLMITRGRDGMVNAGAVSEGCSKVHDSTSGVLQTQGGDRLKQHHISRTPGVETSFTWCARPNRGLRAGPAPPPPPQSPRLRARNLAAAWSLVAREVVPCEKGCFSLMANIKTKLWNCINIGTLDALMMISSNGPSMGDKEAMVRVIDLPRV